MIKFESIPQYSRLAKGIRFEQKKDKPYAIIYFPENSSFALDYKKLSLMNRDARIVILPTSRRPYIRLTSEAKEIYKSLSLRPFQSNVNFPKNQNIIIDFSVYINSLQSTLKIQNFRNRGGILIQNMLSNILSFLNNYETILWYTVSLENKLVKFQDRKIFPLVRSMKAEEVNYDHLMLGYISSGETTSRVLIKDREFKFTRALQYIRNVKPINTEDEIDREAAKAKTAVMKDVASKTTDDKQIGSAVADLMKNDEITREKVIANDVSSDDNDRITIKSILFKITGDMHKANEIANSIPRSELEKTLQAVNKAYADQILIQDKHKTTSTSEIIGIANIDEIIGNKNPSHIFAKRKIDFETNLQKDLSNSFRILEDRTPPIKFQSLSIEDKPQRPGEIRRTEQSIVKIKVKKANGEYQIISFLIPKIEADTGTFLVSGRKKVLINQLIVNPISFPEEYVAKFASDYSTFRIKSIRSRKNPYLQIFIGSYKLPYVVVISYLYGFEKIMKEYKVKYEIVKDKPKSGYFIEVPSSYMVFSNVTTELQKEFVESWVTAKIKTHSIKQEFLTKDYFNDLIISMTGRIESTDIITKTSQNVVDPVVRQVLINKQLPSQLMDIMYYMSEMAVKGIKEDPNDIGNQRIRNSEIIVNLAQNMLLKSYTEYQQQYLSGNENAELNYPETKLVSQFDNIEISQDMEFANPMEEMSGITKISPAGKTVGGISSKRAVQLEARNTHPSYFGNIDPVDTAEGSNIGITNQLTVNALITSARGMFGVKEMTNDEKSGILSTNLSVVPFIENNEGARMIMSANQVRQFLPLKNPTPPIVQSGYESILTNVLSDNFIKKAPCNGTIKSITEDVIDVTCSNKSNKVDISPRELASGSGKNTLSVFKPIVSRNQKVKKGQVIAEGSSISGGTIALGRNLATAYMPYKGYNFEDGLVINERLVETESLSSLHGVTLDFSLDPKDKILYIAKIGEHTKKGEVIFRKTPGDITELLDLDEEDDYMEVYEGSIVAESPGGKIVDIEIFSNIDLSGDAQTMSEKTRKRHNNPKEKWYDKSRLIKGAIISIKIEQLLPIGVGDKLTNRYGNKGIISLIEKDNLMPRTPWGETVELIMNPLGLVSRMIMGPVYELYVGLIAKEVAKRIVKAKNKNEVIALLSSVYSNLDGSTNSKMSSGMIASFKTMSDAKFKNMVNQIKTDGFVPMIIPPFQAPKQESIIRVLKMFNLKSGYHMKLPEYNTKTTAPVPFGYAYIGKLEHMAAEKMHGRSTGPITTKTFQPTAGKRAEGGQKVGEGDTWALASYNATTLLQEMFGPMSDDGKSKNEMINDIVETGHTEFHKTQVSPTRDLVNAYFMALMVEGK